MVVFLAAAVARAQAPGTAAAAAYKPTIVVIPARQAGAPDLAQEAKTLIETPLERTATVVPFESYRRAVLASGHLARDVADIEVIRSVASTVAASHVVVVQSLVTTETVRGKPVRVDVVEVSLIAAVTGEVLYATRHPLSGTRITRSVSTPMVAAISGKLATLEPPAQPSVPETVAAVPVPAEVPTTLPVEPLPPVPVPMDPAIVAVIDPPPPALGDPSSDGIETPNVTTMTTVDRAPERASVLDVYPMVDARAGVLALARDGRISGLGGRSAYDGPLVATNLSVAFFPWARHELGAPERGVGFYGEGYLTRASTDFALSGATSNNTVASIELGAAYRFPLGLTDQAPAFSLQMGYAYSTFPIGGVPFPSMSYSSMEVGFLLDVPIGTYVSAFAGARFFPWMASGNDNLGQADTLYAMRGQLGLRAVVSHVELVVEGRYQQYNGSFSGVTDLGLPSELANVDFVDRYYGGIFSVGYTF